jgi:hypothetical protein
MGCEGRISKNEALKKSIANFKSNQVITKIAYHPLEYNEIATDTILSNGYEIKLKTFTDMNSSILNSSTINEITQNHFYRIVESKLEVKYAENVIFRDIIGRDFIEENLQIEHKNWSKFNLRDIWIDQALSIEKNLLSIQIEFCSIESDECKKFNLLINKAGQPYITELSENNC